jgi:hypothetical protein
MSASRSKGGGRQPILEQPILEQPILEQPFLKLPIIEITLNCHLFIPFGKRYHKRVVTVLKNESNREQLEEVGRWKGDGRRL